MRLTKKFMTPPTRISKKLLFMTHRELKFIKIVFSFKVHKGKTCSALTWKARSSFYDFRCTFITRGLNFHLIAYIKLNVQAETVNFRGFKVNSPDGLEAEVFDAKSECFSFNSTPELIRSRETRTAGGRRATSQTRVVTRTQTLH